MKQKDMFIALALILIVALARLLPHPLGVTPIGAFGLFAGAYFPSRIAWLFPLGALFLGDAANGFYAAIVMLFVYVGFYASAVIGRSFLFCERSPLRVGLAVLASATIFYLLSNFGMWLYAYPITLEGLATCYWNAIPYFGRSMAGDAVYAIILFGGYELIKTNLNRYQHVA